MLTVETITNEEIKVLRDRLRRAKRQDAHTRAIRRACDGALSGIRSCKESVVAVLNKEKGETK